MTTQYKSKLQEMTRITPTKMWNDSCSIEELTKTIDNNGVTGATCNPVIVLAVLKQEWNLWKERVPAIIREMPTAGEDEVAWRVTEEIVTRAAALLMPAFEDAKGKNGRLSIQVNPRLCRNAKAMVEQAERFSKLAPNIIVKIPVTAAGIEAMEEATYRGISINATVNFTVPQAVAVAEAVERGLKRREGEGKDVSRMGAVSSLMVGRLDDWLKVTAEKKNIIANPWALDWAGVAVMKKAYRIYQERGYRVRLLSAAFRNHLHWSEFIGGDVIISPPYEWQQRFNASDVTVEARMDRPVDPAILQELSDKFVDFRRAYDEKGMSIAEFDDFGATRRTLRQFLKATEDLGAFMRDHIIPNPDV